jgi:hypothetical protein
MRPNQVQQQIEWTFENREADFMAGKALTCG